MDHCEHNNETWAPEQGENFLKSWMTHFLVKSPLEVIYEGWNFNSGNYLFTTDTK